MPIKITNVIKFKTSKKIAENIFSALSIDNKFNFNTLIKTPDYVYQGSLGNKEETDFKHNWYNWNTEHWGTKWNVVDDKMEYKDKYGIIKFITANSIPYPIIIAFGNRFKINFTLYYMNEISDSWEKEEYVVVDNHIERSEYRLREDDDFDEISLIIES